MIQSIKRHKYLVDKVFQFRYISMVIIPLIILLVAIYYLIYFTVFQEMLIPEAVAVTLLPAMKKVNLVMAVTVPVILISLFRMALIYSNRIIGPIPRLEKELDKALSGDYSVRIKARDNDELKTFVNKINLLLERVDREHKT
jgi:signal transduction histidine kinase